MYPGVPMTVCSCVPVASTCPGRLRSPSASRPKSRILMRSPGHTKRLSGFRSRWTMPLACAAVRASAIWMAKSSVLSIGSRPASMRARSVVPSSAPRPVRRAFVPSHIEDRHDAGVVQCGGGPGFLLEPPEPILVGRKDLRQHLQRDDLSELRIPGAINAPHAPLRAAPGSRSGRSAPVPGQQSTLAWGDPRSSSGAIRRHKTAHIRGKNGQRGRRLTVFRGMGRLRGPGGRDPGSEGSTDHRIPVPRPPDFTIV